MTSARPLTRGDDTEPNRSGSNGSMMIYWISTQSQAFRAPVRSRCGAVGRTRCGPRPGRCAAAVSRWLFINTLLANRAREQFAPGGASFDQDHPEKCAVRGRRSRSRRRSTGANLASTSPADVRPSRGAGDLPDRPIEVIHYPAAGLLNMARRCSTRRRPLFVLSRALLCCL